jgi:hypothetical protein
MWRGLSRVTVSMNLIFAAVEGKGESGWGRLRFFARRCKRVFLYVSLVKRVRMKEKMAKKMRVHWVQRQDLRTVTKEPMTGLVEKRVS